MTTDSRTPIAMIVQKVLDEFPLRGVPADNYIRFQRLAKYALEQETELAEVKKELEEAQSTLKMLDRVIDKAQALDNASSDTELACSASFQEALSHMLCEKAEQERDQLKSQLDDSRQLVENMQRLNNDCVQELQNQLAELQKDKERLESALTYAVDIITGNGECSPTLFNVEQHLRQATHQAKGMK